MIEKGYSPEFGARPLRRAIEHSLEDPLAERLLLGAFQGKDTITVKVVEVEGVKKLEFEMSSGASGSSELVSAGTPSKN